MVSPGGIPQGQIEQILGPRPVWVQDKWREWGNHQQEAITAWAAARDEWDRKRAELISGVVEGATGFHPTDTRISDENVATRFQPAQTVINTLKSVYPRWYDTFLHSTDGEAELNKLRAEIVRMQTEGGLDDATIANTLRTEIEAAGFVVGERASGAVQSTVSVIGGSTQDLSADQQAQGEAAVDAAGQNIYALNLQELSGGALTYDEALDAFKADMGDVWRALGLAGYPVPQGFGPEAAEEGVAQPIGQGILRFIMNAELGSKELARLEDPKTDPQEMIAAQDRA